MTKSELITLLKTKNAAYILVTTGILLPCLTYPITKISNIAYFKQVQFVVQGVFYEPRFTEYSLSIFGLFDIPFGYILTFGISIFSIGFARIIYLKNT